MHNRVLLKNVEKQIFILNTEKYLINVMFHMKI